MILGRRFIHFPASSGDFISVMVGPRLPSLGARKQILPSIVLGLGNLEGARTKIHQSQLYMNMS